MAVKTVLIPPEAEGMKTAVFLRRLLPSLPESALRKILSARDVKLDGIRVSRDKSVHAGQMLSVFLPASCRDADSLRIVYEDDDVLLVNKPAGISVEADEPGSLSLTDLCRIHIGSVSGAAPVFAASACHRLDHRTCGLCLFAKNDLMIVNMFVERLHSRHHNWNLANLERHNKA